jgi:hypothetical protein
MAGKYTRELTEAPSIDGDSLVAVSEETTDDLYKTTLNDFSTSFNVTSVSNLGNIISAGTVTKGVGDTELLCSSAADFDEIMVGSTIVVVGSAVTVEKKVGANTLNIFPGISAPVVAEAFLYSHPYTAYVASSGDPDAYFNTEAARIKAPLYTDVINSSGDISTSADVASATVHSTDIFSDTLNVGSIVSTDITTTTIDTGSIETNVLKVKEIRPVGSQSYNHQAFYNYSSPEEILHIASNRCAQTPSNEYFSVNVRYASWVIPHNIWYTIPFDYPGDDTGGVRGKFNNNCFNASTHSFVSPRGDSLANEYAPRPANALGIFHFGCTIQWRTHSWAKESYSRIRIRSGGDTIAENWFRANASFNGEFTQHLAGLATWRDLVGDVARVEIYITEASHQIYGDDCSFYGYRVA